MLYVQLLLCDTVGQFKCRECGNAETTKWESEADGNRDAVDLKMRKCKYIGTVTKTVSDCF